MQNVNILINIVFSMATTNPFRNKVNILQTNICYRRSTTFPKKYNVAGLKLIQQSSQKTCGGSCFIDVICIYLHILVSNTISISISWCSCRLTVTWWVWLVEQELLTLPEHQCSPQVFSGIRFVHFLVFCVMFCRSFLVLFLLAICAVCPSSITASDYPFGIFKLFLPTNFVSKLQVSVFSHILWIPIISRVLVTKFVGNLQISGFSHIFWIPLIILRKCVCTISWNLCLKFTEGQLSIHHYDGYHHSSTQVCFIQFQLSFIHC